MTTRQTVSASVGALGRQRLGTRAEVAAYLGVPVGTLARWGYKNAGPPYVLVGRHARYDWADVDAWLSAQKNRAPTA